MDRFEDIVEDGRAGCLNFCDSCVCGIAEGIVQGVGSSIAGLPGQEGPLSYLRSRNALKI